MYTRRFLYAWRLRRHAPAKGAKGQTSRCHRKHTWLLGATLAGLWSKKTCKVAVGFFARLEHS